MAATKYIPKHFAGLLVDDAPQVVFAPGTGDPAPQGQVLTGIVVANGASSNRELTLYYTHDSTSIYLFKQLLLPQHSTTNLDLYLPLEAGQNLIAFASAADDLSLTLYGLELVSI